jgi:hypothetical protein|tara:strand:+ start:475 stop:702 length:228 start_codon:yes stop_codon:yes gene_type:complete
MLSVTGLGRRAMPSRVAKAAVEAEGERGLAGVSVIVGETMEHPGTQGVRPQDGDRGPNETSNLPGLSRLEVRAAW